MLAYESSLPSVPDSAALGSESLASMLESLPPEPASVAESMPADAESLPPSPPDLAASPPSLTHWLPIQVWALPHAPQKSIPPHPFEMDPQLSPEGHAVTGVHAEPQTLA